MPTVLPTLIVGIGTTGYAVLEDIADLWYTTFREPIPPYIKLLVIETEKTKARHDVIKVINISPQNDDLELAYNRVKGELDGNEPNWLKSIGGYDKLKNIISLASGGAFRVRAAGRLYLWHLITHIIESLQATIANNFTIQNQTNLQRILGEQFQVGAPTAKTAYVIGTLSGGTGSGLAKDIGFLIQEQLGINNIFGIFLTHMGRPTDPRIAAGLGNNYVALRELEFYLNLENREADPDKNFTRNLRRNLSDDPYRLVYLIGGSGFPKEYYETAKKLVALKIFMGTLGLSHHILYQGVQGVGIRDVKGFVTFGLSGFMHPKREIAISAANILSIGAIKRLVLTRINAEDIRKRTKEWIQIKIEDTAKVTLPEEINKLLEGLYKKEYDLERFIEKMKGELNSYKRKTIERKIDFYSYLRDEERRWIRDYKNLIALKEALELLRDEIIDELMRYWDNIGIPNREEEWDNKVSEVLNRRNLEGLGSFFSFGPASLGKYYDVVKEKVEELAKELTLYKLRTDLNQLKASATTETSKIKKLIDDLNKEIEELIREIETLKANLGIINDTVVLLYKGENFEDDIKKTLTQLLESSSIEAATLRGIGKDNINEFISNTLLKVDEKTESFVIPDDKLFRDFDLDKFLDSGHLRDFTSQKTMKIFQGAIPDLDVASAARQKGATAVEERRQSAAKGFLRFHRGSAAGQYFTGVFIAGSAANRVANGFPATGFTPLDIPHLDGFCLFLSENKIDRLADLEDLETMEGNYSNEDLRENYLFDTFDIESLRREAKKIKKKGEIERILRMTLHLFVDYKLEKGRWIPANSYIDFLKVKENNIEANISEITYDIGNPFGKEKIVGLVALFVNNPDKWMVFKKGVIESENKQGIDEIRNRFINWAFNWNPEEASRLQDKYLQLLQNLSVEYED